MRPGREAGSTTFIVRIDKLVYGGFGLGRYEGRVVFVPFTVPGDLAKVQVVQRKKNFLRASVVEILEPGPGRQAAPCPHFGRCGGCQWQHLEYSRQLENKRQILEEVLHHQFPESRLLQIPMTGSPEPFGYRSHARIQLRGFGTSAKIGFFQFQSHRVEDVELCPLFRPLLNRALAAARQNRYQGASDPGIQQLELACSEEEGTWSSATADRELDEGFSATRGMSESEPSGGVLKRRVGEFTYSTWPSVFFQANDYLIGELVQRVEDLAAVSLSARLLDLFSGVGLFTLPLARRFQEVVALENSLLASQLCAQNASEAGLSHIKTICADASSWMAAVGSVSAPAFDLVLLDPPRAGAGPSVMERLVEWAPETILYVSCDPHTLARDLALLVPRHYEMDFIEGFDLFPQTYHFEVIVRLRRNN